MKVFSAKVQGGNIVPTDGTPLAEGASVTVLADDESGFDLSPPEEAELLEAIAEAERGDLVPADVVLQRLRR